MKYYYEVRRIGDFEGDYVALFTKAESEEEAFSLFKQHEKDYYDEFFPEYNYSELEDSNIVVRRLYEVL